MRVLTHKTIISCPHGTPLVIVPLGHPLKIGTDPALTVEEIEAALIPCVNPAKCGKATVTAGQAQHLSISTGGRRLTPVLDTLQVTTNIGPCQVQAAFG